MRYGHYLETWQDYFGDEDLGMFAYWHYGKEKEIALVKLDKDQFHAAVNKFDALAQEIDKLQGRSDYATSQDIQTKVDALMEESFWCELSLFF